jgi:tRNA G10  N-methylase Trm11
MLKNGEEKEKIQIRNVLKVKSPHIRKERMPSPSEARNLQLNLFGKPCIEVLDATRKGGLGEPMHSWFPLIEGYSPGFVKAILNNFAPSCKRVLDPFSGTGTTALEAFKMGKEAFYCEINQALQFLTQVKIQALKIDEENRKRISEALHALANNYKNLLSTAKVDHELELSYFSTFGNSQYFTTDTFTNVLKARSIIDELYYLDEVLADFLTIATLASLVPASLTKRAGDLRFRRPNEIQSIQPLEFYVRNKLNEIAIDLLKLPTVESTKTPLLVCEDARKLKLIKNLEIDAVVTSPPYVNGTNYFRNTKLELWFLRCLHCKDDLKRLRMKAVTVGINDVQKTKVSTPVNCPELKEVITKLESKAYDKRIPMLIESYFSDLDLIFDGVSSQMVSGGLLAVDIGDSIFAGVHVPTDKILLHILQEKGYVQENEVVLRRRKSHCGSPLKQVLLILRKTSSHTFSSKVETKKPWSEGWHNFKENLPHQRYPFSKRNWGHPLHSLCSYEGKMKPSLAHHLVKVFVPKGGRLLDPFAGVGTIPFEAALHGVKAYGFEISPAAFYIAAAKIEKPDRKECLELIQTLKEYIHKNISAISSEELASAQSFGFNHKLAEFYHPETFKEIFLARKYFMENKPSNASEYLVMASLLHILHGNRPYALSRRSHPITPFAPSGPFEYRPLIPRLEDKVNRSLMLEYPVTFVNGKIFYQDATQWWPSEVDDLDAIITSPPFFDSTRFYLANWLRLWFCGWEPEDFKKKPKQFLDERQKISFRVYESVFRQARERLKENGVVVLHLGKSEKCDMAQELAKVASPWFEVADIFEESVAHCESHGIRDKGTVKEHQYLILH